MTKALGIVLFAAVIASPQSMKEVEYQVDGTAKYANLTLTNKDGGKQQSQSREGGDQDCFQAMLREAAAHDFFHRRNPVDGLLGVGRMYGGDDGPRQTGGVAVCPDRERHAVLRALVVAPVDLRARFGIGAIVAYRADDAHNLHPRQTATWDPEATPDGASVRKDLARSTVIDQDDRLGIGAICLGE